MKKYRNYRLIWQNAGRIKTRTIETTVYKGNEESKKKLSALRSIPACRSEDVEMLEDLLVAAVNEGMQDRRND